MKTGMTTEQELLPCPCCNNRTIYIQPNGIGDFYAICGDDEVGCGLRTSDYRCESKKQAAERWNARAQSPNTTQLLDAFKAGMTEAKHICESTIDENGMASARECADLIESARDKRTTI